MKQYILIKEYPNSPRLGCKIHLSCNSYEYGSYRFNRESIENNPEFWKEIIDYPINTKLIDTANYITDIIKKEDGWYGKDNNCPTRRVIVEKYISDGKRFQILEEKVEKYISDKKRFQILEEKVEKYISDGKLRVHFDKVYNDKLFSVNDIKKIWNSNSSININPYLAFFLKKAEEELD
jgi:hypothetical protein